MAQDSSSVALGQIATLYGAGSAAGLTDGQLLDRFRGGSADQAEAAFAALVDRHARVVLHVCRRILGDRHDAEDAAQATFLVLARRAGAIRRGDSVASWLCGVAARVAARARRDAERRLGHERRHAEASMASGPAGDDPQAREAARELHEELGRLPERFRLPIILFHLEGLTYEEAARHIGCPVRTVQSRLDRGRRRLRDRLARRGRSPSAGALAAMLAPAASTLAPAGWKRIIVIAAVRRAAGGAGGAVVSPKVVALAQGASKSMTIHRLMMSAFLASIGLAAGGLGLAAAGRTPPPPPERPAPAPASSAPDPDRYRATVAGASIEVVAVSSLPSGPGTWLKPDGTRLAEAPVDRIEPHRDAREGEVARAILVRSIGFKKDDLFRWHPIRTDSYWGGRPRKGGEEVPGLESYEATFPSDLAECDVEARVAAGEWRTEVTNDGGGGVGQFVNGHKFSFGRARAYARGGRAMTVLSVAHNFMEQDRRIVAVGRDGERRPAVAYSLGSDGDKKWLIDLIDAEFPLPPDQIRQYEVQFRPIEQVLIRGIALNPAR